MEQAADQPGGASLWCQTHTVAHINTTFLTWGKNVCVLPQFLMFLTITLFNSSLFHCARLQTPSYLDFKSRGF